MKGGHEYVGEEVPRVRIAPRMYQGSEARVMVHRVTNGGHHFSHLKETE